MAKRFITTDMWEKPNWRKLPVRLKVVWFYLISKCNHAGIWECDIDLLSFQIGESYTLEEIMKAFNTQIVELGDNKYFLSKYISFQYGVLNPNVKVHQSVIKLLKKYNIQYEYPELSVKDKDKDISKNIKTRKSDFALRVEKEVSDMKVAAKDIQDFISYWSEHNTDGRVMRFEKQDIFNVKRRMQTWIKNSLKFQSTFQPSNEDIAAKEEQLEKEYQDQQRRLREADANVATDDDRKKALGIK